MSDTHDNLDNLQRAVKLFNGAGVSKVYHAGDFTSGFTFRVLKDLKAEFMGIFGNNDGDVLMLEKFSQGRIRKQPYEFTIEGKKAVMVHEHFLIKPLKESGIYDVIIYGHTHKALVETHGHSLVINPGETCGWLHGKATVALLDTGNFQATIIDLISGEIDLTTGES